MCTLPQSRDFEGECDIERERKRERGIAIFHGEREKEREKERERERERARESDRARERERAIEREREREHCLASAADFLALDMHRDDATNTMQVRCSTSVVRSRGGSCARCHELGGVAAVVVL